MNKQLLTSKYEWEKIYKDKGLSISDLVHDVQNEIISDLERSINTRKNDDGSYTVDIGDGLITFTINTDMTDPDLNMTTGTKPNETL